MKNLLFTTLLFVFLFNDVKSQNSGKIIKKDIEIASKSNQYHLFPIGKEGLIIYSLKDDNTSTDESLWELKKLNTDFSEIWKKEIKLNKKVEVIKYYTDDKNIYLLVTPKINMSGVHISKIDAEFTFNGEFTILKIDIASGNSLTFKGNNKKYVTFKYFTVQNYYILWGGNSNFFGQSTFSFSEDKNYTSELNLYDISSNKQINVDFKLTGNYYLGGVDVDSEKQLIYAFLNNKDSNNSFKNILNTYSFQGELKKQINIDTKGNIDLTETKLHYTSDNQTVIVGAYSNRTSDGTKPKTTQGIFFTSLKDGVQQNIFTYKYADMKNCFYYLGKVEEEKNIKSIQKKKEKGIEYDLNYKVLVHDLVDVGNQYIFVAEVYETEISNLKKEGATGNEISNKDFEGWHYSHSIIVGFDKSGKLLWDQTFLFTNIRSLDVRERVNIINRNNEYFLIYQTSDFVFVYKFKNDHFEKIDSIDIPFEDTEENILDNLDMLNWYDGYFLTFISDSSKNKGSKKTRVLNLHKISTQ